MPDYIETELSVLDRAFSILESVAVNEEMSVHDIQERFNMTRSTAYRFLASLTAHGYIEKSESGKYRIGRKIMMLAGYYLNDVDLVTTAQPVLRKYSKILNLSMYMSILHRSEVITVANADNHREGKEKYAKVGDRMTAIGTAMGKCLLAGLSGEEYEERVSPLQKGGSRASRVSEKDMRRQIVYEVRERGYVIDDGEFDPDIRCVAAPVYDYRGDIVASVCACGELYELSLQRCKAIAELVVNCATEISSRIGHSI